MTDLKKKRHASADLHTPTHPPQQGSDLRILRVFYQRSLKWTGLISFRSREKENHSEIGGCSRYRLQPINETRIQKIFSTRLICFKNYLLFIITEYELAVVTRKKDLLPFALGQRTADTKRTLK